MALTFDVLMARKAELDEARERIWAELNQILGAITFCDGLLAELDQPKGEPRDDGSNQH